MSIPTPSWYGSSTHCGSVRAAMICWCGCGGEELAWVTTWPDVAVAVTGVEWLRVLVRERTAELGVPVTVSIGVARVAGVPTGTGPAVFPAGAVEDPVRHALNRADQALYRAKAAGRDRVETASEEVAEEGFEQRFPR